MLQLWQKESLRKYLSWSAKKLAAVLATSLLVTLASRKADLAMTLGFSTLAPATNIPAPSFEHVPCIYYPVHFKKDQAEIQALIHREWGQRNNLSLCIQTMSQSSIN